jgi:diguanylate cyclase (GGDEF)-like protein
MKGLHSILRRWNLTTLIGALTTTAVLVTSSALLFLVIAQLRSDNTNRSIQAQELSVGIGASLLEETHDQAEITWSPDGYVEKIIIDQIPDFNDNRLVDSISRITGEPATVFGYDAAKDDYVRLSTTVHKSDGSRAVGTVLGKDSAANAPIRRGEIYIGRADILNVSYYTSYHPIFDRAGEVIGIIFAGVKEEAVVASGRTLVWNIVLASGILLAVMVAIALFAARAFVRPVPVLANVMRRMANTDLDCEIPYAEWNNEVGGIARALAVFRDQALEKARVEKKAAEAFEKVRESSKALEVKNVELDEAAERLEVALNHMGRGLSMFDAEHRLVVCNKLYREIYNLPERFAQPGTPIDDILQYSSTNQAVTDSSEMTEEVSSWLKDLEARLANGSAFSELQRLEDGRVLNVTFQPLAQGGWVDLQEDITERHTSQAKIAHMARHDALTDLPNRVSLGEHLERLLAAPDRDCDFSVLFLDLDGFKGINDTLGHNIGDALLKEVAERLSICIREGDVVARLGGDEFAIIQSEVEKTRDTEALASRIIEVIKVPYMLADQQVIIGTSVGIARAPHDGSDAQTLLRHADLALYRAKKDGRGRYSFFDPEMSDEAYARQTLERDVRAALALDELELFYQPQVDAEAGELQGFEALLRWRHPQRGLVSPADFIPLAEETGLIVPIGTWVLRQACAQAQLWPNHLHMAVNVSAVQLRLPDFAQTVMQILSETGLPPHRLEIEITEWALVESSEATLNTLRKLHDSGVRLSLDDFGTGYSSLSYLRTFPIDKIKIDRSFVMEAEEQGNALAIIRAVADLGHALGLTICAEGVESEAQLTQVRSEGCTEIQGFLISRPQPADVIGRTYFSSQNDELAGAA